MNNIFEAAEFYISKGFKVFPVHGIKPDGIHCTCNDPKCVTNIDKPKAGKHPATKNGRTDAVGDIASFRKLVGARENLNIAIATGPESDLWSLDVDGVEGVAALDAMGLANSPIHKGAYQSTGRGQHWAFKYPTDGRKVFSRTEKLGPKLDVRGAGGYIVAAPSRHALGHTYQWNDGPLAPAPDWLVDLVSEAPRPTFTTARPELEPFTESDVLDMLDHLKPDNSYDNWYQVGMALEDGGYGLNIWESWSRKGSKYKGHKDCKSHWGSFKGQGITMGTLVFRAQENGWKPLHPIDRMPMESHPAQEFLAKISKAPAPSLPSIPTMSLSPIIQDITQLILRQSVRPQPTLALLNVFTFLGAIFGRRYQTHTGIRTNIYAVGIAPSTIGKDQSRKTIQDIMARVPHLNQVNGGDSIISTAGLVTLMGKFPRRIIHQDEFGLFLQAISSKNASSHEHLIVSMLMQLFSKAQGVWTGAQYADKDREQEVIASPHLCVFGTSTLGTYAAAMKQDAIESGYLNRFIVLPGDEKPPFNHNPEIDPISPELIKSVQHLNETALSVCHGIADTQDSKVIDIAPHTCAITDDAKAYYQALFEEQDTNRVKDGLFGPLWGRMAEHSIKLAMVNAICRTPEHPVINLIDLQLGESIARRAVQYSLKIARENMNSGEFHKQCQFIEALIRNAGTQGITRSKITKAANRQNMRGQDVGNVLDSLLESDIIKPFKDEALTGKSGVKATVYYINPE